MNVSRPHHVSKKGENWFYDAPVNGRTKEVLIPEFELKYVGTRVHSTDPERTAHTFHADYFTEDLDQSDATETIGKAYRFFAKKVACGAL